MHICRWIDKGQTWDIYLVWLDGPRLAHHSQASLFCWGYMGGESESRSGHTALKAEIRCLFMISIVRKESDTALSQQKWAACVISVQMRGKVRNDRLFTAFHVRRCPDGILQADISALCFCSDPADTNPELEASANANPSAWCLSSDSALCSPPLLHVQSGADCYLSDWLQNKLASVCKIPWRHT